jgi:hypothetical protein
VLVLVAASMFPHHVEGYFAEVFTAVLVGVGLLAVATDRTRLGWILVIVGVVNTPAAIAGLIAVVAWRSWESRRVRDVWPIAAALALIAIESWVRRGSPLSTGYEGNHGDVTPLTYAGRPGFSYPLFFGLLSVLFSFGKGLVFYAPGLLAAVGGVWSARLQPSGARAPHVKLWIAFLVGLILVYAKWWAWYGGLFWGPRFFLFASIPASYAIAVALADVDSRRPRARLALLAIVTLSSWVAIDGVMFGLAGLGLCRDPTFEWACLYVPEYSALWRPFVEFTRPGVRETVVGAYCAIAWVRLVRFGKWVSW